MNSKRLAVAKAHGEGPTGNRGSTQMRKSVWLSLLLVAILAAGGWWLCPNWVQWDPAIVADPQPQELPPIANSPAVVPSQSRPEQAIVMPDVEPRQLSVPAWEPPWADPPAVEALRHQFHEFVATPELFEERLRRDAAAYPEGPMLVSALVSYGLANYAIAHPEAAADCQADIASMIEIAGRPWVRRHLDYPMAEDVHTLKRWNGHGFFLGHYALMLGCYRVAGGDARYAVNQQRIAQILKEGVESDRNGVWITSYRQRSWLFDSLACLLAVRLSDQQNGLNLDESTRLVKEHLRYRRSAVDEATGLTNTEIDHRTGKVRLGPRGCDLSGTICFLGHLAPAYCRETYARYKQQFWVAREFGGMKLCGFREWPMEAKGFMDMDSGPILFNIGAAASGFGLGASRFARDDAAHRALLESLDQVRQAFDSAADVSSLLGQAEHLTRSASEENSAAANLPGLLRELTQDVAHAKQYHYRHLMADTVAFYCLTWCPWCQPVGDEPLR